MKIVLATGIYPPDIGGPATYSSALAEQLHAKGHDVTVIAYTPLHLRVRGNESRFPVINVDRRGGIFARWKRYANALREHASDADIVYAFSSVSCGVPLRMAKLKKPKKILRLGGDFFWERYTEQGGAMGLAEWYGSLHWLKLLTHGYMKRLLRSFDHIVFSTKFQEGITESHYKGLPSHSIIENAVPQASPSSHVLHSPLRILFMGRFVGFKNLPALVRALPLIPDATLSLTGEGPMSLPLVDLASSLALNDRLTFISPVHEEEKDCMIDDHDVLIIPSTTEISPNIALEARSRGLPVLLTKHTGLSAELTRGMIVTPLRTPREIADALIGLRTSYDEAAKRATDAFPERTWARVTDEHLALFTSIL